MDSVRSVVESVYREEYGRILAGLISISRSFDLAEEAIQDAFAAAVTSWREKGVPANPAAWITTTSHRKLIDYARRERTRRSLENQLLYEQESHSSGVDETMGFSLERYLEDDRLRLIFTCCHPALNKEAQIALTLRTLGGLTTLQIARAFLIPEATLAQRLVRARRKIEQARIPYEVPTPECLPERISAVQTVLYLIFNEGYSAGSGEGITRGELCAESIRLARTLAGLMPEDAENTGLLALMLLHDSRRDARFTPDGQLVLLEDQDRSRWRQDQISEGKQLVEHALRRRSSGPYQIQAAIAAVHADAKRFCETDWRQIACLYAVLSELQPSPVISLNHAVAVAMGEGLVQGLEMIDQLGSSGELESYYPYHAARADLLRRMERSGEALKSYHRAISLTSSETERRYFQNRVAELTISNNEQKE